MNSKPVSKYLRQPPPTALERELVEALAQLLREHECLLLVSSNHTGKRRSNWHEKAIDAIVKTKAERDL